MFVELKVETVYTDDDASAHDLISSALHWHARFKCLLLFIFFYYKSIISTLRARRSIIEAALDRGQQRVCTIIAQRWFTLLLTAFGLAFPPPPHGLADARAAIVAHVVGARHGARVLGHLLGKVTAVEVADREGDERVILQFHDAGVMGALLIVVVVIVRARPVSLVSIVRLKRVSRRVQLGRLEERCAGATRAKPAAALLQVAAHHHRLAQRRAARARWPSVCLDWSGRGQ